MGNRISPAAVAAVVVVVLVLIFVLYRHFAGGPSSSNGTFKPPTAGSYQPGGTASRATTPTSGGPSGR